MSEKKKETPPKSGAGPTSSRSLRQTPEELLEEHRSTTRRERLLKRAEPRAAIAKVKRDIKRERLKASRSQKRGRR